MQSGGVKWLKLDVMSAISLKLADKKVVQINNFGLAFSCFKIGCQKVICNSLHTIVAVPAPTFMSINKECVKAITHSM